MGETPSRPRRSPAVQTGPVGVVTFHRKDDDVTTVQLVFDYEPTDFLETVADALGVVGRQTEKDLENFKSFIESRGNETGASRTEVEQDDLT